MGKDLSDKDFKYHARKINRLLKELGWINKGIVDRYMEKLYGRKQVYVRPSMEDFEDEDLWQRCQKIRSKTVSKKGILRFWQKDPKFWQFYSNRMSKIERYKFDNFFDKIFDNTNYWF